MKTFYALLSTIAFAILSVALLYFAKGLWENMTSVMSITINHLAMISIAITEYFFISGFAISLIAFRKRGFHNLKNRSKDGLIIRLFYGLIIGLAYGLVIGLILGLIYGLIIGLVTGIVTGIVTGLAFGLIYGLIVGLVKEKETDSQEELT